MKTIHVGILWTGLLGAAVAGGIAATNSREQCAYFPIDGGTCIQAKPDGGVQRAGPGTKFKLSEATGQCEVRSCR